MRFRHYDALRIFTIVAHHRSFSTAAEELNLTKGAVSYQIKQLEQELGFMLFRRLPRGIRLTSRGQELLGATQSAFEGVEQKIAALRHAEHRILTIGVSTYFASRWLSSRLMKFLTTHPEIRLRVQPMIDLIDLRGEGIDIAIRWGRGEWTDMTIEPLFPCPAWPTGNAQAAAKIAKLGQEQAFSEMTLLRDRPDSNAWSEWYAAAGIRYQGQTDTLLIPDPNVRVQAVIDGQGIALNDKLAQDEIDAGHLCRLSDTALDDYGYFLAYAPGALANPDIDAFATWLRTAA